MNRTDPPSDDISAANVAEPKAREEEKVAGLAALLTEINKRYSGKKLVSLPTKMPIRIENQSITITFKDGEELKIELFDASDDWYWTSSSLIVNGINLDTGKAHSDE